MTTAAFLPAMMCDISKEKNSSAPFDAEGDDVSEFLTTFGTGFYPMRCGSIVSEDSIPSVGGNRPDFLFVFPSRRRRVGP